LPDRHYKSAEKLAHAIADVLAAQVEHLDADVVQDEANLPGQRGNGNGPRRRSLRCYSEYP
ncbi:MAG TPA: hypothetical protein VFT23_02770, partial [Burkholderiales bacterium]|nr:hypothetical protein [Burkholderiales bacterium]